MTPCCIPSVLRGRAYCKFACTRLLRVDFWQRCPPNWPLLLPQLASTVCNLLPAVVLHPASIKSKEIRWSSVVYPPHCRHLVQRPLKFRGQAPESGTFPDNDRLKLLRLHEVSAVQGIRGSRLIYSRMAKARVEDLSHG
jgi:hypothetical protein